MGVFVKHLLFVRAESTFVDNVRYEKYYSIEKEGKRQVYRTIFEERYR